MFLAQFHGDSSPLVFRLLVIAALLCLASCHPSTDIRELNATSGRVESILDQQFDADHTFESMKYFTQFWRIGGGPGFDSCLAHIEADIKSLTAPPRSGDAVARYEIFEGQSAGTVWVPEDAILSMESPEALVLHTFASTPVMLCQNSFPHDVTARLAYVPRGNKDEDYDQIEVKAQIVLCDVPAASAYRFALKRGAVGVLSCYVPPHNQPRQHPDIIAESGLPYDNERKPFAINISPRTAQELKQRLAYQQVVLRVQVKSSFIERPLKTLAAEIPGTMKPDERVVLVAHLDHYKPGANDNASGSATLLEAFRSIASSIQAGSLPRPARTMTFLWVDEYRGTSAWIKRDSSQIDRVLAAFVLDMVGGDPEKTGGTFRVERIPDPSVIWFRPPEQHSGWGAGTWDKNNLFGSFLNDYYLSLVERWSARTGWKTTSNVWEGGSDHDPFLWRKVPAVLSWHFPDFAYHSSLDQVSNISAREMKNAGISVAAAAYQLALGTEDIGRSILQTVGTAWRKRLELIRTQIIEQLEEVQSQGSKTLESAKRQEKEILEAWAKWYDEALQSVVRVPARPRSQAFDAEVQRQREELQKNAATIIAAIGL